MRKTHTAEDGKTRYCKHCDRWLSIDNFLRHKRDGYQSRCKECKRSDAKRYYRENPEKFRARARAVPRERQNEIARRSREKHRDEVNAKTRAYFAAQDLNWHKRRYLLEKARTGCACNLVAHAVRKGKIMRSACEICGNDDTQGHHDDYTQPYVVRWLCRNCHESWHMRNEPRYLPNWEEEFERLCAENSLDPTT